jgi:hypothetical protein
MLKTQLATRAYVSMLNARDNHNTVAYYLFGLLGFILDPQDKIDVLRHYRLNDNGERVLLF